MFHAVERDETLASRVTGQVEQLIADERLRPGDRLPAERDLALKFQVSRTVIREAIRSLMARGMLDVRQGRGTTVCTPSVEDLTQPLAMLLRSGGKVLDRQKVTEVRRLLEVHIAGTAAERRTADDLKAMQGILDRTEGIRRDRKRFVSWDMAFHSALAQATQNELFSLLLGSVAAVMRTVREVGFDVEGTPDRALKHHQAILTEVKNGNAVRARRAMEEHLSEAEKTMTEGLRLRGA